MKNSHTKICVNGHPIGLLQRKVTDFVMDFRKTCDTNTEAAQILGITRPTFLRYKKISKDLSLKRLDPDFQATQFECFDDWHRWHEHELKLENETLAMSIPFLQALVECWKRKINMARPSRTGLCAND